MNEKPRIFRGFLCLDTRYRSERLENGLGLGEVQPLRVYV